MEVVEGDKERHQERENQEEDWESSGYGILTTEILHVHEHSDLFIESLATSNAITKRRSHKTRASAQIHANTIFTYLLQVIN